MNKEFVKYKTALALKELGFDEPCLAVFNDSKQLRINSESRNWNDNHKNGDTISSPLYQQSFRWIREKYGLIYSIGHMGHSNTWAYEIINMSIPGPTYGYETTYEEAESACLDKLIELVKNG